MSRSTSRLARAGGGIGVTLAAALLLTACGSMSNASSQPPLPSTAVATPSSSAPGPVTPSASKTPSAAESALRQDLGSVGTVIPDGSPVISPSGVITVKWKLTGRGTLYDSVAEGTQNDLIELLQGVAQYLDAQYPVKSVVFEGYYRKGQGGKAGSLAVEAIYSAAKIQTMQVGSVAFQPAAVYPDANVYLYLAPSLRQPGDPKDHGSK